MYIYQPELIRSGIFVPFVTETKGCLGPAAKRVIDNIAGSIVVNGIDGLVLICKCKREIGNEEGYYMIICLPLNAWYTI